MSEKIYLDANVYLDYCLGTDDIRPLDEFAKQILDRAISCEFIIVISDILQNELKKHFKDYIKILLPLEAKNKIQYIHESKKDKARAKSINLHFPDNLHVYLAEKHNCTFFVTNDKEILKANITIKRVDSHFFQFE